MERGRTAAFTHGVADSMARARVGMVAEREETVRINGGLRRLGRLARRWARAVFHEILLRDVRVALDRAVVVRVSTRHIVGLGVVVPCAFRACGIHVRIVADTLAEGGAMPAVIAFGPTAGH